MLPCRIGSREGERVKRPTIVDIARQVGVSKAAVSYALNGRGGVSAETRERILDAAERLGWRASSAARALSNDRTASVGFVFARPPELLRTEPFFMQLLAGMEQTLSEHGVSLQLALASDVDTELATYRRWWAERRVDGVMLTDLRVDDPRPPLLRGLGAPAVLFGAPSRMTGTPVLCGDEVQDVDQIIEHLAALGHRDVGYVRGAWDLQHTRRRSAALGEAVRERFGTDLAQVHGGSTEQGGLAATRELLAAHPRPSAVIYDNDVMAVATVARAAELGVRIPGDLAVIAWDDSMLCRVVEPAVTAFEHDVVADAATAAHRLLELIETGTADDAELSARRLVVRASSSSAV